MFTLSGDTSSKDRITPHRLSLLVLIKSYADIYDGRNQEYPRLLWLDGKSSISFSILFVSFYHCVRHLSHILFVDM